MAGVINFVIILFKTMRLNSIIYECNVIMCVLDDILR